MDAYYEFKINCNEDNKEAIIAELAEADFEGFEERDNYFYAFIPKSLFSREGFDAILTKYNINPDSVPQRTIEPQNWNAQWEASYEPIIIGTEIIVKAPFHLVPDQYKYELIIQPKNTFGTGHHETTQLMLEKMLRISFENKNVFDYGCGTGVLSIMASKLGAEHIFAIDIDDWSAENINENCSLNEVRNIQFKKGDIGAVPERTFDIILANINKTILINSAGVLSRLMNDNGIILISGFYENDLTDLKEEFTKYNFAFKDHQVKNDWCAAVFIKTN